MNKKLYENPEQKILMHQQYEEAFQSMNCMENLDLLELRRKLDDAISEKDYFKKKCEELLKYKYAYEVLLDNVLQRTTYPLESEGF